MYLFPDLDEYRIFLFKKTNAFKTELFLLFLFFSFFFYKSCRFFNPTILNKTSVSHIQLYCSYHISCLMYKK